MWTYRPDLHNKLRPEVSNTYVHRITCSCGFLLKCLPLLAGLNWARGVISRVTLVHKFVHLTAPSVDLQGQFLQQVAT